MKNQKILLRRVLTFTCTLLIMLLIIGCNGDARAIWKSVIKKCANNDLLGNDILFFGPSNNLGPGTIFQKFATGGGIQVSHLFSEYTSTPESLIYPGQTFACTGTSSSKTNIGADLSLESSLSISGTLGIELKKAKTISVNTDSVQWVDIITGPFKQNILNLPEDNSVKNDLLNEGHLVLSRALRVRGMHAELSFSSKIGGEIKAKFPEINIAAGPADAGIGIKGEWISDTKLVLDSTSDFYIAGELRKFLATGLAAPSDRIGPIEQNVDKLKFVRR